MSYERQAMTGRVFCDEAGREWSLKVSIGGVESVRELKYADGQPVDLAGGALAAAQVLGDDWVLLCAVLWRLCERQALERGVSAAEFGEALCGDALEAAYDALVEAMADFRPTSRRALFAKVLQKGRESAEAADVEAARILDDPATMAAVTEATAERMRRDMETALMRLRSDTGSEESSD